MNLVLVHLIAFALSSYGVAQPAVPSAPAAAATPAAPVPTTPPPAAATAPAPVPPEKMDAKALLYPRTVVRQEIEIGKAVVPAVISQLLAGMASGGTADAADARRIQEMLSSESVRTALVGMTRLLVVAMIPAPAEAGSASAPAPASYAGDKVEAHYGDLFSQHGWTSAIRTVEPQLQKSFHLMLGPEAKGLFFVVADRYGITTVLLLSESSLRPLLDVLAPILGKGIFPAGLPTPSSSTEPGPAR